MQTKAISIGAINAVEVMSDEVIMRSGEDALDMMAAASSHHLILHKGNFPKEFFDLSTRIAGEILQKFANYQVKLAIIGDFDKFKSKTLKDFIYESNKNGDYLFVPSIEEVKNIWGRTR